MGGAAVHFVGSLALRSRDQSSSWNGRESAPDALLGGLKLGQSF